VTDIEEEGAVAGALRLAASHPRPDVLVISIHGELDELTAPEWTAYLREHDTEHAPYLVLDLAGITFIGSAGIALLLTELAAVQATHQLFLTGVADNRRVGRILELVGVLDRFRTYPDVAQILADLDADDGDAQHKPPHRP
jgi:anti-sigma B factor antagonist